jgi:hypothetical protein
MTTIEHDEKVKLFWVPLIFNGINFIILIILAFLNFDLNKKVEKYKINESFMSEFNAIRAEKIGESWAEINEWEAQISLALEHYKKFKDNGQKHDSIFASDLFQNLSGYEKLFIIERNRFWLGEKQYKILGDFATLASSKFDNCLKFNQDSINNLNKLIHQKRKEADDIIKELLDNK